jgi:2-keto-4-pentenoate hydratase/2-oxohepta-3-ene-1,7-dioic acid hydratase in catechol pathway
MRLITYTQGSDPRPGLALDDAVGLDLLAADPTLPDNWHGLFAVMDQVRVLHDEFAGRTDAPALPRFALAEALLLPPVLMPQKIIAVGRNYRAHAEEQNRPLPAKPMLFSKAPSCLQRHEGPIEIAADLDRVDAEAELAVVIGRPGRAISRAAAPDHIAGYMCFNDVSDRTAQQADKQFFRGKSIDTGGPCGPWIVTPDELPPLAAGLDITCRWNDEVMQHANTDDLIFPVDVIIEHASRNMTLLPGDIIATGTPGGVGVFREPPVFLRPDDVVEVAIERIGLLRNTVRRWEPR